MMTAAVPQNNGHASAAAPLIISFPASHGSTSRELPEERESPGMKSAATRLHRAAADASVNKPTANAQ
jgi:hypothetical protein